MDNLVTLARRRQSALRAEMARIEAFIRMAEEIAHGADGPFAPACRTVLPAPSAGPSSPTGPGDDLTFAPAVTAYQQPAAMPAAGPPVGAEARMPRKIIRRAAADGG